MNRHEMELASASTSAAVPAAKRRRSVASLVAASIVAAALLFAMPSLAFASNEAETSSGGETQEILLSKPDSSTSVNKAPDTPNTSQSYKAQDAYTSTPNTGVDVVSGAGDSTNGSYTPGDDKSSINDKDSDDDSDASANGTEDGDDSTANSGTDNAGDNTDKDSTDDSNGAISGSTDENATDKDQSAVPTGSNSKADDVIATPCDGESADQNASATSGKTEEVQASNMTYGNSEIQPAADITTQAATGSVTIFFQTIDSSVWKPSSSNATHSGKTLADIAATRYTVGYDTDPIFFNGTNALGSYVANQRVGYANGSITIGSIGLGTKARLPIFQRYGYNTTTQWYACYVVSNARGTTLYVKQINTSTDLTTSHLPDGAEVYLFPIWTAQQINVAYYQTGEATETWSNGSMSWTDTLPSEASYPITYNPCPDAFDQNAGNNGHYYLRPATESQWGSFTFGSSWGPMNVNGYTVAKTYLTYEDGTPYINGTETIGQLLMKLVALGGTTAYSADTYNSVFATALQRLYAVPGWKAAADETFKINFTVGSNTGRVTVTGDTIKVDNNGSTKPTSAQITAAGASATDANKNDGWVLDGTKWSYTMGTATGTLNSLADLANLVIKADVTLSPVMKQNTYSVTLNGGLGQSQTDFTNATSPVTVNSFTGSVTLGNPSWTGRQFQGWSTKQQTNYGTLAAADKIASGTAYNSIATKILSTNNEDTTSITLYAWWTINTLTITYNGNPKVSGLTVNNVPATATVNYGANTTAGAAPTSNGYTFTGWNTAANGTGTPYAAGAAINNVTSNITLYAQWTEKTGYKVTFYNTTPGSSTTTVNSTQGGTFTALNWTATVTVPAAPTAPAGYSFDGWYTTMTGSTVSGTKLVAGKTYKDLAVNDTTLELKYYAKWNELDKLTFTMNLNGTGASYNNSTNNYTNSNVLYNGSVTIPNYTNPSRTGYNFKGWSDTASGAVNTAYVKGYTFNNLTANKTIYAIWEAAPITITYAQSSTGNIAGVNNVAASTAYTANKNYGDTLAVPAGSTMFTRPGYTFSSWGFEKTSGTGTVAVGGGNLILNTSNILLTPTGSSENGNLKYTATIYANWNEISYTIVWNTQGGNTIANTTGLNGDSIIATPTPTRSGYTFQRWDTASTGSGGKTVSTGNTLRDTWTLTATNTTLNAYAIWKENVVQIQVHSADTTLSGLKWGGTNGASITSGTTLFVGAATGDLYTDSTGSTKVTTGVTNISTGILPSLVSSNHEWKVYSSGNDAAYTSKWTLGSKSGSTVTANTTTGLLVPPKTNSLYTAGAYYLTVSPKKYAYTIEYYNQNVNDNNYTKVTSPAGSGTQFYGHTVTAGTTAGTSGTTMTVVPETQTGFTRKPAAAGSVNSITIGATTANNVLKFYYDRNTYTVTATYTGDRPAGTEYSPATQTVRYGATVTLNVPEKVDGYNFSGWRTNPSIALGTDANGNKTFVMPAQAVTATGTWGLETVNVTFVAAANGTLNTSTGAASQDKTFGSTLTAIPTITISNTNNYYFMGWALYKNCTKEGDYTTGTLDRIYSPEEILGTGAYVGNAWTVPAGDSVFVARIMPTLTVAYVAGTGGAFSTINGSVSGTKVTTGGTYYTALPSSADNAMVLPKYCVNGDGVRNAASFDGAGVRNQYNPKSAAGYKFIGWTWFDTLNNVQKTAYGTYNSAGVFTKTSGDDMPTNVNQSYTFTGVWEKTYQQLHFVNTCVNGTGVTGGAAPADVCAQLGDKVTIPTSANYAPTNKPASAYTFLGWTTDSTYKSTSPLYDKGSFTMTAGTQATGVYTMPQAANDFGYGVTLYAVFQEKTVTINYALATGVTGSMASLNKTTETIKMDSGTAAGSTATAKTGYTFKGWYSDAAHSTLVSTSAAFAPQKDANNVYVGTTYYAYFEAEEYTITFKVGDHGTWTSPAGGTTDKTVNLAYNTTYGTTNIPATKADTGYGFVYWRDQNNKTYTTSILANEKITGPMTFTAIWEPRSGYTLAFETNGGSPSLASKSVTWTASIAASMDSASSNIKRQGYTFAGWYAKADFSNDSLISTALNCAGATDTFATGIAKSGQSVDGDTATLTLYAKWTANNYTIAYDPKWPKTNSTTFPNRTNVTWTDTNLLPTGGATLSQDGQTFTGWNTKADGSGKTVTNADALRDLYVSLYGANDYSTTKTITLYGQWGTLKYNVQFKDASGNVVKSETNKNWDDAINYYSYAIADGSKTLIGWKYTPVNGAEQTWASGTATKLVSEIGGDPNAANKTFVLTAVLRENTKWEINFNKVNLNADGTPNIAGATKVANATKTGYATPGVAINIENFNSTNYITAFENQNGAGRRADLTGYALDKTLAGTKLTALATEVTEGGTIVFNVYWVEKIFDIEYQLGVSAIGNLPYAGTSSAPAPKQAGWNSSNILPDTTPTWEGYKAPKWQYQNAAGTWVTVPTGAKVSDIAKNDDNSTPIILRALWDSDQVRITYAVQTGGSASNGAGFSVLGGASKYQDIDAVTGTAYTMTATASSGYTFTGWYKDGVLVSSNATFTPTKEGGLYSTATYEARFRALGSIQYTIEHHFEDLNGNYVHDASKDETRGGQEFATINVSNDMKKTVKGFTYKSGITGEKLTITSLIDGEKLILMYSRNEHDVFVQEYGTGADHPVDVPQVNYPATGITSAHTTHKYGESLVLPTITAPTGWSFQWKVVSGATDPATLTLANGATFTMFDADVDVIGVWTRLGHSVQFTAGDEPHGTVTVTGGATLPFTVDHGKTLADASSTGTETANIRYTADADWAFAGWSYEDENGVAHVTYTPDTVTINADTVFKALWAQTFFVAYNPGTHGGNGFTSQLFGGRDIEGAPNVNTLPLMIGGVDRTANAPAASGYSFVGWQWTIGGQTYYWVSPNAPADLSAVTFTGTPGTMDFAVRSNVIFEAIWQANEQELIYKLDTTNPVSSWAGVAAGTAGDEFAADPKPRTDQIVTLLTAADVAREGYELAGWVIWTDKNADGVIQADELSQKVYKDTYKMPSHRVVMVPVWDFAGMKINFVAVGPGTVDKSYVNITDGDVDPLIGATATGKAGYQFEGWYSDPDLTHKVSGSAIFSLARPVDGWTPATFYAKFVAAATKITVEHYLQQADGTYTVHKTETCLHFNSEDSADATDENNHAYQYRLDVKDALPTGYVFNANHEWQNLMATVSGAGDTTLKLYYDRIPFQITYDLGTNANGEEGKWLGNPGPNEAYSGQTVSLSDATLSGMKFIGWTITWKETNADGEEVEKSTTIDGGFFNTFTMPNADVLATALWAQWLNVEIELVMDDGKSQKVFGDTITIYNAGTPGDIYEVASTLISQHRPFGYSFTREIPHLVLKGDGTRNFLQVIYDIVDDYAINFNANTGKYADGSTNFSRKDLTVSSRPASYSRELPTKFGYTLGDMPKRWNTKADGSGTWLTATMTFQQLAEAVYGMTADKFTVAIQDELLSKGLTVYAIWSELDNLEVKYDLNNDKNVNSGVLKPVPDWRNPLVIEDLTGVKWSQSGFNLYNDKELDAAPHGYEFAGWNTKADGTGLTITDATKYFEMSNAIDPNAEQMAITLYAMWKEIMVKIEYTVTDGGTIDRVVDYVSAVTGQHVGTNSSAGTKLHSVATAKTGYHFVRWELVSQSNARSGVNTENEWYTIGNNNNEMLVVEPDEDGRLYGAVYRAVFEKNADSLISYDPNGGEGEISATVGPHSTTGTLSNGSGFKRSHHTLVGWNTAADGSGVSYKLGQNINLPEGGLQLYAVWNINSYGVNVKDRGDHVADVVGGKTNVPWGEHLPAEYIAAVKQTPKQGSTFKGWSYTMTDADTGEVITGVVMDLNELIVLGPVEIEALYDTEDIVTEGTTLPKTGDENGFGFILALIALALAVVTIILFARRSREEDGFNDGDDRKARFQTERRFVCDRAVECIYNFSGMRNGLRTSNVSKSAGTGIARAEAFFMLDDHHIRAAVLDVSGPSSITSGGAPLRFVFDRVVHSRARSRFFAVMATFTVSLLLAATIGAPGSAMASTGDSGSSGSAGSSNAQVNDQTQNSNADPASTSTGSSVSASSSASASASSRSNGSSASAKATSTSDEIERLTYRNALAHSNRKATGKCYTVVDPAKNGSAASVNGGASSSASETAATSRVSSLTSASAGISSAARSSYDDLLTASDSISSLDGGIYYVESSKDARTSTIASRTGNVLLDADGVNRAANEWLVSLIDDNQDGVATVNLCSGAATPVGAPDASGAVSGTNDPSQGIVAALTRGNDVSSTDEDALLADEGLQVNAVRGREDEYGVMTETVSDSDGAFAVSSSTMQMQAEGLTEQDETESVDEKAVQITYKATKGGSVDRDHELISSISGAKLNDDLSEASEETLQGATAKASVGYSFDGWVIETPSEDGSSISSTVVSTSPTLDAATVEAHALTDAQTYQPVLFTARFTPNAYVVDYDLNGGSATADAEGLTPKVVTYSSDDAPLSSGSLKKQGYEFLCWNTDANGKGVSLQVGEALTENKLRAMIATSSLEDRSGAGTKLYAQWVEVAKPEQSAVLPTVSVIESSSQGSSQQQSVSSSATSSKGSSNQISWTPIAAAPAISVLLDQVPAEQFAEFDPVAFIESLFPVVEPAAEVVADVAEAIGLPPALEVLPATAEGITTVSADALAGVAEGDMTPAGASKSIGTALTTVAAVTALAGAAGAASAVAARAKTSNAMTRKRRWKFADR